MSLEENTTVLRRLKLRRRPKVVESVGTTVYLHDAQSGPTQMEQ
jgi:hypothetical protein